MSEAPNDSDPVLDGLSERALRYLATLALRASIPLPSDPGVDSELRERGLLGGGDAERLAELLADGDLAQARGLIESWDDTTCLRAQWSRLYDAARGEDARRFVLELALRVGTNEAVSWVSQRPVSRPALRAPVVEATLRLGEPGRAREMLEASPRDIETEMLYGEALLGAGDTERSIEVLRALEADGIIALQRDIRLARALFHGGHSAEAISLTERLEARVESLSGVSRYEVDALREEAITTRIQLGMPCRKPHVDTRSELRISLARGMQLATAGRLVRASTILRSLRNRADTTGHVRIFAALTEGIGRIARGEYDGLMVAAREIRLETERAGNATLYHWSALLELTASLSDVHAYPEAEWPRTMVRPTGTIATYLAAVRACHAARRGEAVDLASLPRPRRGDGDFVQCACDLVEAFVSLLQGQHERAASLATGVARRTSAVGHRFFVGEARLVHAAALLEGRSDRLVDAIRELEEAAEELRSERYASFAALFRGALSRVPDCPTLLGLCHASNRSPSVARIARHLLGGVAYDDAFDALIARGVRRRWDRRVETLDGKAAAWTFDASEKVVQLPGRSVRLGPTAARVLSALFHGGGELSLDALACEAWGLPEFHPLRDAKRVHVAMRRLRVAIEDQPSARQRLRTIEGGYALGGAVGQLRAL